MAEYAPHYFPADKLGLTTSATVTAGQVVRVSGNKTVAPVSAAASGVLGVAAHDAASGAPVVVYTEGVHEVAATGAITAGSAVVGATGGSVAAFDAEDHTADQIVGVALAAAASDKVLIKLP
ncbi:scaffolding protein [Mycobacterium phage Arib1]|uniref:Scaffolding protein n=3 Tax=Fishburnevirus TaxID=1983734 RepID=A0A249XTD9_9CAUD|nr:scaffolding protein [Mycobacterium phage Jebeks]YP_009964889.1 scaffolding protein [Mycobacterium phage Arib1]YP_009964967.1 scaffolding protein [Mycobacterium phage Majeke]AYQ99838.1 scaffolding protein [Mycobacterium phage Mangethe]URP20991.1 scaffolding protein [Mycobacterium phage Phegasus]WDW20075.1 scaffolding protein [Mycobacterium phage Nix22]ASZ75265.1 scaffolding protein [Mycobacterium phage Majeke]ATN87150.1 scaffolding protein [Mycobacterium phage Arib1]